MVPQEPKKEVLTPSLPSTEGCKYKKEKREKDFWYKQNPTDFSYKTKISGVIVLMYIVKNYL